MAGNILHAQTEIAVDSILAQPDESFSIRSKQAYAFSSFFKKVSEPSLASMKGTDFHRNTSSSLQKKSYALNITIQPVLNLGGKRWFFNKWIHTFQVVPSITARVFSNDSTQNDHSLPIRTPSFIARGTYALAHQRWVKESGLPGTYLGISLYHHSNGQDTYEFDYASGILNTYDGNFSEEAVVDFFMGGFYQKIHQEGVPKLVKRGARSFLQAARMHLFHWRGGYEYHPRLLSSPKFLAHHLYARKRLFFQCSRLRMPQLKDLVCRGKSCWATTDQKFQSRELSRLALQVSYIVDGRYNDGGLYVQNPIALWNIQKRLNIDLTWYERVGTQSDYALFARLGYYGSDPYNIYFQQSIFVFRFGVAFGVFQDPW
jgi:hypothetical protein